MSRRRRRIDSADLIDLGGGDRLLVGDDGKGFERGEGELQAGLRLLMNMRTASWHSGLVAMR